MNRIKVLFIGDTHGDDNTPDKRKDSYLEACLEEMQECVNIADERGCDLVVHLGDVFHRIEPGPLIRNGYLKILSKAKTPWYTVIGNHDVKHNLAYFPQSSIRTLVEAGALITGDSIEEYGIFLAHHTAELNDQLRDGYLLDKPYVIVAAHATITLGPFFGSYVLFNEIKTNEKTKLIVCGHVHDAMESEREDGVKFINPGSVCREKLNEANKVKEPKILYVEYDLDGNIYETEYVKLDCCKPSSEIFKIEETQLAKDNKKDTQQYIKQITTMNLLADDMDIYESLRQSAKIKKIDDKVIDLAIQTLTAVNDK